MRWFARFAWLGRMARDVVVEADGGRFTAVSEGVARPAGAVEVPGVMLPGLVNCHSHVFHRALRGRVGEGDFWSWREEMYRLAGTLNPDGYYRLARATYAEMALAGITAVGEFHYLHHPPDGGRYSDPNEMGRSIIRAAEEVGIRVTLLDTCYLRGDFDQPLLGAQRRFSDGDVSAWADRSAALEESELVRVGAAVHSVRAVDADSIREVIGFAERRPLHVHVSEQPAENQRCLAATGVTPVRLLAQAGMWEANATAVHATHLDSEDVRFLGSSNAHVCLCPTTERDLGDGIGPAQALASAGARLCVGSDSHVVIDLLEEARLVELHQRLRAHRRGLHPPADLLAAATATGADSLGWDSGAIAPGQHADFCAVRLDTPRTSGWEGDILGRLVYAATGADVETVVVGGTVIVRDGTHARIGDVGDELGRALGDLDIHQPR